MARIIEFPKPVPDKTPDDMLEEAKLRLEHVIILGWDNDGDLYMETTCDMEQANFLLDIAKQNVLAGCRLEPDE